HLHEELQLVELVDRDGAHELVTTNLDRYLMPVIRQATGDLCEWLPGACACGRKTARLRHVGRRPKHLKVGGEKLPLSLLLEELLGRLRIPSSECAVVVDCGTDDKDVIRIKLGAGALADPAMAVSMQAQLFEASAKLGRQIQAGIVAP